MSDNTDRVAQLEAELAALKKSQDAPADEAPSLRAVARATDPDKPKFVAVKGERFRLPELENVDIDVLEAFEQGKAVSAAKGLIGDQAVSRIRTLHGGTLRAGDLEPILEQVAKVYGFTSVGESAASSD